MAIKFLASVNLADLGRIKKKIKRIAGFVKNMDGRAQQRVGETVVDDMKALISKGISPIKGKRRFKAYRGKYKEAIKKKRLGGKKLRPVDLKLSGKFLDSLTHKRSKGGPVIFYRGKLSEKKEQGHREGANKQEKRPTIPQAPRENFAVKIQEKVIDILDQELGKYTK